jgi:hypothetical protein
MKKVVLVYGVFAGIALIILSIILQMSLGEHNMITGYVTMVLSLLMVFFGIKSYRDQHLGGRMTFGQGFKVGILITLIASVFYVVGWEIYSSLYMPNFMDDYAASTLKEMKADGASAAKISETMAEMEQWKEMYKNPLVRYGLVFLEIFPVGLLVTLISAAILKRKGNGVASATAVVA